MKTQRVHRFLSLALLMCLGFATSAFGQLGGPVIIGGDDADDHGSVSGTTNQLGWLYIEGAFDVLGPNVSVSKTKKAVCLGCNGGLASGGFNSGFDQSNLPGAGWTRISLSSLGDITNFFNGSGATNLSNAGIIYMPTDGANVSGGINSSQLAIVNSNALAIKNFVAGGGGLFTHDQTNTSGGFGWLSTLLPGIATNSSNPCSFQTLNLTAKGQTEFPLLTDAILSGATPWHSWFSGNFGGLEILVTGPCSGVNRPVILGGARVSFSLKVTPAFAFNVLGTSHTVTAEVKNNAGQPVAGDNVTFAVLSGPNAGASGSGVTDANGNATFTYTGNSVVGLDLIQAIHPSQGSQPADPDTGYAQKLWDKDCNENQTPDSCDISCAGFGGLCANQYPDSCGQSLDADGNGEPDECNRPPDCTAAAASDPVLWPPNHKYRGISVLGVTDPDGDPVTITVTGITQDEPTNTRGDGNTCPDGQIVNGEALVRAERTGTPGIPGNGRVYRISFTASDGQGGQCTGSVTVCVPHDQGQGSTCVDDGQIYNSLGPCNSGNQLAVEITEVGLTVGRVDGTQAALEFALPRDTQVDLGVFDVAGRRMATIENGTLVAGQYQRAWDMSGATKGLYFVRLRAGLVTLTRTVVKLR